MPQHQHATEDQRCRINLVLALVLRRAAVRRLENRRLLPDIRPRRHAQSADQTRTQIADDIAVEIRQHDHIVQLRLLDQLHAHIVDDPILELDVRVVLRHLPAHLQPQPVRVLHDIGLVHAGDLLTPHLPRVVEGKLHDPPGPLHRDRLDADPRIGPDDPLVVLVQPVDQFERLALAFLVLDPRVQVLGVLPDHHQIDVRIPAAHPLVALARPQARIQPEALPQMHVDAPKPRPHRSRNRRLQRHPIALDRLDRRLR